MGFAGAGEIQEQNIIKADKKYTVVLVALQ